MADNKINKLLASSKLSTTNTLLSTTTQTKSSLLTSSSLKSSILEKSLLDDRKKKSDDKVELNENKKPKLTINEIERKLSIDTKIKTTISTSSSLLKSQTLTNNLLTKFSSNIPHSTPKESLSIKPFSTTTFVKSHITHSKPSALTTTNNLLLSSQKENLENYVTKEKSVITGGVNITVSKEVQSVPIASDTRRSSNIRHIFEDLTNSKAYLDLINTINNQNKQFDEETKAIDEKSLQFCGFPDLRKQLLKGNFELIKLKNLLINLVSSSLLKAPNFKDPKDQTRFSLIDIANRIIPFDGEFILKLALYTRKELNIRVTANFLIALASFHEDCRKFLSRYYSTSVVLPSDWIDIAEQYQIFSDKRIKFGALPSALRKTMVEKFPDFDEYQLGKYNKDKSKSKKNGALKDVKHTKAQLKFDEKGNEIQNLVDEDSVYEEKYIKTLKQGLKIKDLVEAQIFVKESCKTLKIDLVAKKIQGNKNEPRRIVSKRGGRMPVPKDDKPEETVPLRFNIDYSYNRVTKKTFLNKSWSRADVKMNNVAPVLNINNKNTNVKIAIAVNASNFEIKVDDKLVMTHEHSKHNTELIKINCVRISGIDIKLNELVIENTDKISHDENETEEEIKSKTFNLKQLVRQLHISKPIQHVFGLLGKKYPATYEEYLASGLPGVFDSQKAGKRMRLAIPETWETQISMKGNKAPVWEQLIDNKKLPYMAMLRNLRNMIKAGIDEKHHQWVLKKLQDEGAVINSKQFPINFFSAYDVIDELQKEFVEYEKWAAANEGTEVSKRQSKKAKQETKKYKDMAYDEEILTRYKKALDNALKVATTYNISPIKGKTLVFIARNNSEAGLECKTARIGKSKRTVSEISALLGLMFKYSCEHSRLLLCNSSMESAFCSEVELQQGTILDNMKTLTATNVNFNSWRDNKQETVSTILGDLISNRTLIDNVIVLSQGLADNTESVIFLNRFLSKYRVCVNERLLFVNVDLGATDTRLMLKNQVFVHENDVTINGYSDSILRFVAERGNQGQLIHIENIEKSYELPALKTAKEVKEEEKMELSLDIEKPFPIINEVPKWITTKVFISSTFRDMHTERDILSRVVFPVLKSKLSQRYINVYEVDLRWGITESEANEDKTLDLCLKQVLECDFFVGMLGERYGQIPLTYQVKKNPKLNWLNDYPAGASITELEIQCATFEKYKNDRQKALERSFFYFRDQSFISDVPEALHHHFVSENMDSELKLASLKDKIKTSGFEVYDGYKCEWLGLDENNRALLTKLDDFAQRVFNNLLNAITVAYPHDKQSNLDEYSHASGLHDSFIKICADKFIGRQKLVTSCEKLVKDQMSQYNYKENKPHILLVDGDAGVGKTSFMCYFTQVLRELTSHVFAHIVNSCPGSEYTLGILKRFAVETIRNYNLSVPENTAKAANDLKALKGIFNDILLELKNLINDKFIILIDGVDLLLDSNGTLDESLSWLPEQIPPNITIILSARNTSRIQEVLNKKVLAFSKKENKENEFHYDKFSLSELEILEKSQIVRQKLDTYNKKLDETGFNNQMKLITNKKDASNPLYLALACEELRFHNNFETLNNKLKDIPHKLAALVPYVLARLENDYGVSYTASAFSLLLCSKDGLKEYELKNMLDLYCYLEEKGLLDVLERADSITDIKKHTNFLTLVTTPIKSNSEGKFLSFVESISDTFLRPFSNDDSGNLRIKLHPTIENCLRLKFSKSTIAIENTNKLMSLYYWFELDKDLGFNWSTKNLRAYSYLPYHLSMGNCNFDLLSILSSLKFLAAKSILGLSSQLLEDYEFHGNNKIKNQSLKGANKNIQVRFNEYKTFFTENYHIISKSPTLIFQQAMNQPPNSAPSEDLKSILLDKQVTFMFEETNKDTNLNEIMAKVLPLTIKEFNSAISSISISQSGQYIACGTEDCEIRVYSSSTATLIKKLHGHSGKINDLCFVGSDTLCSTSSDGLASLWNISGGYRIKILNKHNGHVVSACSAEPNGKFLVTVGWDCTVKIWNSSDGNFSGEIRGHGRPINCVAYHPDGNMIATGCWDGCIRLLDVFNRQRKAVFRGQNGSIRSITFSKNGVYIAAASINGDVALWNTANGSQVGVFQGHTLPVNCLKYSPTSEILATGSSDRKIKLWPATPGKCVKVIKDDKISIGCVCFNPKSGKSIAVGYHTGEMRIYDFDNVTNPLKCKHHSAHIRRIKFTPDAKHIISVADNGTAVISSSVKGNKVAELLGHSGFINGLDVSKLDSIVTGCEDASIRIYDFEFDEIDENGKMKPVLTLNQHTSPVTACSFNSYGTKFVSSSKDATLIIWSYQHFSKNATVEYTINAAHPDWITDCYWSPSAEFILTASNDFTMKVFDATTGKHKTTMTGHSSSINTCSFQYGCAISTSSDGSAKVWSHKGYEITTLLGHQGRVNGCDMFVKLRSKQNEVKEDDEELADYAPIESWGEYMEEVEQQKTIEASKIDKSTHKVEKLTVVTVSDDCSIRIWHPLESEDVLCLEGHNDKIESLALGSNNIMCTASYDRSVKIWNLSSFFSDYTSGKIIHDNKKRSGHNSEVTRVCSNKNGTVLLTTSRDGILIVWNVNYVNQKLTSISYLNEFEVHEACCNDICIISENDAVIEFATCSDDKKLKIWELNISDLNQISLKLKQQIYQQRQVLSLSRVTRTDNKKKLNNLLISVDTVHSTMMVNIYDIDKSYKKVEKTGCLLAGYGTFIYDVKVLNSNLCISLINSYVLKLNIDDMLAAFKNYNFSAEEYSKDKAVGKIVPKEQVEIKTEEDRIWYTCLVESDTQKCNLASDFKGNLHRCVQGNNEFEFVKKLHDACITDMIMAKIGTNTRLITASKDGIVKIWTDDAEKQLGQYNFNSGITCVRSVQSAFETNQINIVCADQTGDVHVLVWYDKV